MNNFSIVYFNLVCCIFAAVFSSCDKNETIHDKYDSFNFIEKISFGNEASEQTISFTTGQKWKIELPSDKEWYTISPREGEAGINKITVSVTENSSEKDRNGVFTIQSGELSQKVSISQKFTDQISLNSDTLFFSNSKGEQSIDLIVNKNWEASLSDPQNQWCELIPLTGDAGMGKLTVKVKKNTGAARYVTISITVGKKFKTTTVYQEENKLILKLTNNSYPNWEDCQSYVNQEFGEGWVVADWTDILLLDNPRAWAKEMGMKHGDCSKITFNGESNKWGNGYYIAYFPDGLPAGQGSVADYECFFVGIWNMNNKVVAKKIN